MLWDPSLKTLQRSKAASAAVGFGAPILVHEDLRLLRGIVAALG